MEEKVRAHVRIYGKVQGVFFRMETQQAANKYGVVGWVRNLPDGSVEALFEGDRWRVEKLIKWCETGPPLAEVMDVDVRWEPYSGTYDRFDITY